MIHARTDYEHIQDDTGKIANDEPVFLLRAIDATAPATLRFWADQLEQNNGDAIAIAATRAHADLMEVWQNQYGCKAPDTPADTVKS